MRLPSHPPLPRFGTFSGFAGPLARRGFTLVEILTTLAIIAILVAIATPLVPGLLRANQLDSSIAKLSGILEQARETAVASSTYTWVAFTAAPNNSPAGTWVATIQSLDGTENPIYSSVSSWVASPITVPGTNLQLSSKIQNLPGIQVVAASTLPAAVTSQAPSTASPTSTPLYPGLQWTVIPLQSTGVGSGVYFTQAIEFTPAGEARIASTTYCANVQFGLVPTIGSKTKDVALFNVSRLTGKTSVYRQ